tara:strand:+ start:599 stop:835 length:237 start_codon:yes stop_codon:yes gene_type:complete
MFIFFVEAPQILSEFQKQKNIILYLQTIIGKCHMAWKFTSYAWFYLNFNKRKQFFYSCSWIYNTEESIGCSCLENQNG